MLGYLYGSKFGSKIFSSQTFTRRSTPTFLKPSSFFTPTYLRRWNRQNVPKRRHIKFRRRGITQKKAHNIRNTAKVRNQEDCSFNIFLDKRIKSRNSRDLILLMYTYKLPTLLVDVWVPFVWFCSFSGLRFIQRLRYLITLHTLKW